MARPLIGSAPLSLLFSSLSFPSPSSGSRSGMRGGMPGPPTATGVAAPRLVPGAMAAT